MKILGTLGSILFAVGTIMLGVPVAEAQPADCHSSYDPCVPITSDVDCAGGSGDGPEYTGPVHVIGPDEYGLDQDGNGLGCENS